MEGLYKEIVFKECGKQNKTFISLNRQKYQKVVEKTFLLNSETGELRISVYPRNKNNTKIRS